jgi:hypothetical protein
MKLSIMADSFQKQLSNKSMNELSFEERFGLIVDAEWLSRKNNRLTRLIKNAIFAGFYGLHNMEFCLIY